MFKKSSVTIAAGELSSKKELKDAEADIEASQDGRYDDDKFEEDVEEDDDGLVRDIDHEEGEIEDEIVGQPSD